MSATINSSASIDSQRLHEGWLDQLRARVSSSDSLASLLAVADQGMISATSFVTSVAIGRSCGAETLGMYALIVAALAMLLGVQEQLTTAPYVMNFRNRSQASLRKYTGSVAAHQAIFTILAFAALLTWCIVGGGPVSSERALLPILLLAIPALLLRAFIRELALAHCDVVTVLSVDVVVCVVQIAVVLTLFVTDVVHLTVLYGTLAAACLLTVIVWSMRNRHRFVFDRQVVMTDWHRNWRFGRWALATHIAGTSTPYAMPWVLFALHGEKETGVLAACSVIVGLANILLSGMADFLTPRAAAAYAADGLLGLRRILKSMTRLSLLTIGGICLIAFLFGPQVIDILYAGRFEAAGKLVGLLTLAVLANALGNVAGNGLWALNQPRANFLADVVKLAAAIGGAAFLVQPYGAYGAAVAILLASVVGALTRFTIFETASRAAA